MATDAELLHFESTVLSTIDRPRASSPARMQDAVERKPYGLTAEDPESGTRCRKRSPPPVGRSSGGFSAASRMTG